MFGAAAEAVPICRCRTGPGERAGGFGAGGSCSLALGPRPQHCVIFTSYSHLELSVEYFCHILVLSSVRKDFLLALLVNPLRMLFALGLFYSPPPRRAAMKFFWRFLVAGTPSL